MAAPGLDDVIVHNDPSADDPSVRSASIVELFDTHNILTGGADTAFSGLVKFSNTESAAVPSLVEYPEDGHGGVHFNTTTTARYFAWNHAGTLYFIALNSFPPTYGSIAVVGNIIETVIPAVGTPVKVDAFDTNGIFSGTIPDHTDDSIEILNTGVYDIDSSITVNSTTGGGSIFEVSLDVNAVPLSAAQFFGSTLGSFSVRGNLPGGANDLVSKTLDGFAVLNVGDKLTMFIENQTSDKNYVIDSAAISLILRAQVTG